MATGLDPLARRLERDPKRKLQLARIGRELWRAEAGICRTRDVVPELPRHWTRKIREAVDVVDIFHIGPVQQVEHLNTGFSLDTLGERNRSLQAHIDVIERIA